MKQKILFVCIHNSARSVMAEAFVNTLCGDLYEAQSAGLEPGRLNPLVATAMAEIGIDVTGHQPRAVAGVIDDAPTFAAVITVCDETSAERCPHIPGGANRVHWAFPDPSTFAGTPEEKLAQTREVRDLIEKAVRDWCTACRETTNG